MPRFLPLPAKHCVAALLALGAACRKAPPPPMDHEIVLRDVGFSTPESVLHDPLADMYFVSNINGAPLAVDDNGFISAVSPEGKILALKAIDGATDSVTLNAPKGLAVAGDFLYVTDINTVRRFDRRTGGPRGETPIPGSTFLNDIAAAEDGSLYVTDSGLKDGPTGFVPSGSDAVYRIRPDGKLDTLAMGAELGHPNGIAVRGDSVWVVTFGTGELYRIEAGKRVAAEKLPKGTLDGLVLMNGEMVVSS